VVVSDQVLGGEFGTAIVTRRHVSSHIEVRGRVPKKLSPTARQCSDDQLALWSSQRLQRRTPSEHAPTSSASLSLGRKPSARSRCSRLPSIAQQDTVGASSDEPWLTSFARTPTDSLRSSVEARKPSVCSPPQAEGRGAQSTGEGRLRCGAVDRGSCEGNAPFDREGEPPPGQPYVSSERPIPFQTERPAIPTPIGRTVIYTESTRGE
jgi:hypothetical protein